MIIIDDPKKRKRSSKTWFVTGIHSLLKQSDARTENWHQVHF